MACLAAAFLVSLESRVCAQSSGGSEVNGAPLVTAWVPPVYPTELKREKVQGDVLLFFIINEAGEVSQVRVAKSSDKRFEAAALASLEKWKFQAGLDSGKPVAMGVGVKLFFKLPEPKPSQLPPSESYPNPLKKSQPEIVKQSADTNFPVWLESRITSGVVFAELGIDVEGKVAEVTVLNASHPDFVRRSEAKFKQWAFKPARQGPLVLPSKLRASLEFTMPFERQADENDSDVFSLNPPEGVDARDYCDKKPERISMIDPVFPYELATSGKSGEAVVRFTLSEFGNFSNIEVVSATDAEFGRSLMAALEGSEFKAGAKMGRPVALSMTWKHFFTQPPAKALPDVEGEAAESAEARMIRHLASGAEVLGAKGLDGKLRPVWRAMPIISDDLKAKGGKNSALVEFIIDREGRACLPRVINSTSPEFGWAAITALNQWVFDPLTRGGQSTEARVRVPFEF